MIRLKRKDVAVIPVFDGSRTHSIANAFTGKVEGLIIPDVAKERADRGVVKYIGSEVQDVKYGDFIMFAAYDGTLCELSGEGVFIVLPENKVVAIIEPPETPIDGVYFKSPPDETELELLRLEIVALIKEHWHLDPDAFAREILKAGFIKDQYFPATYEMTVQLISEALSEAPWNQKFRFVDRKKASPSVSEVFR